MDTALIIVIVVAALLVVLLLARRGWARSLETRREKAGELRVESAQEQEQARQAEREAERQRERAERAARRAERIDPDAESGGGRRFGFLRRSREDREEAEPDRDRAGES